MHFFCCFRVWFLQFNDWNIFCYCKDATLVARNQEAMEAARRKMQEDLDAKAVLFKEKQKQVGEVLLNRRMTDKSFYQEL